METITIHKNKPEAFKCQLNIEGADIDQVSVRLLLEFEDNKNLLFYGKINEDGDCIIKIPKLKEIESKKGRLVVEAIADNTHFELYEAKVELKNSVEVKMVKESVSAPIKESSDHPRVSFKLERVEPIVEDAPAPVADAPLPRRSSKVVPPAPAAPSPMLKKLNSRLSSLG